ncbi:MAG: ADP-ribose pyrophosphatase YjhB (NUDIX family) [Patiriisocius sp.]|jgi:ADP-ribose pyrophosphatase YjhB (NUDIX family)
MSVPSVPVLIVPVDPNLSGREHGVYTVRRGADPFIPSDPFEGLIALPGGFQIHNRLRTPQVHETWQQGGTRETEEEIQVHCDPDAVEHVLTESSYSERAVGDRNLIFGKVPRALTVEDFVPSQESIERVVLYPDDQEQLCFSIHRKALAMYWDSLGVTHNVQL